MRKWIGFNWIGVFVVLFISCETEKGNWTKEAPETKYSRARELEVWNRVLLGTDVELFLGTPVYKAALSIVDNDTRKLMKRVKRLDENEINFQEDKYGMTLGELAVRTKNFDALKVLLQYGLDPNVESNNGQTVFLLVASGVYNYNDNSLLIYLLNHGGDVNYVSSARMQHSRTPLIAACSSKLENVKLILDAGANPNYVHKNKVGMNAQSAFNTALLRGDIYILNHLVFESKIHEFNDAQYIIAYQNEKILEKIKQLDFPENSDQHQQKHKLLNYFRSKEGNGT